MTLDFNETCIVNQTLETDKKEEYIRQLLAAKEATEETEIRKSLDSLVEKISILNEAEFHKLRNDRMAKKIFTFPPYSI